MRFWSAGKEGGWDAKEENQAAGRGGVTPEPQTPNSEPETVNLKPYTLTSLNSEP